MFDNRLYVAQKYFVTFPSARTQKWVEVSESDGDGSSVPGGHSRVAAKAMFIVELTKAKPDWSSLPTVAAEGVQQQRLPAQSQLEAGGSTEGADRTTGDATFAGPQVAVSSGGVLCGYDGIHDGYAATAVAVQRLFIRILLQM